MDAYYSFGYWVRRRRKALDLTQEDLARQVACALSTIKKIELDERRPSVLMAERLAQCLQIPSSSFNGFIKTARAIQSTDHLNLKNDSGPFDTNYTVRGNIPLPATRLVGRVEQVSELWDLLHTPGVRMVTLSGPGGVGKTRLALHIASKMIAEFPHSAWVVELAPLNNPLLIAQEIISVLGIQGSATRAPLDILISYLKDKRLLLVLDNCEHLLDACAQVAHSVLQTCPNLIILTTSRETLNIPEEYVAIVPPLKVPDLDTQTSVDDLLQSESVSLFMDRTWHLLPSFKLTDKSILTIAQICSRLDGLPLAIELAAARIHSLSPDQIYSKLDDSIDFLDEGFRTSATRQQTMQNAIDWSVRSLTEPDQILLRRLSVFAGGCTLRAVEAVCGNECDSKQLIDSIGNLIHKSLLNCSEQYNEPRYTMLETIRQYSREMLIVSGEQDTIQERFLKFYQEFAEEAEQELIAHDQIVWVKYIDLEIGNLRFALTLATEDKPEMGLRLATALNRYWRVRNLYTEGMDWLKKFLDITEDHPPSVYRARALCLMSFLGTFTAPIPETWAKEGLAISEELKDEKSRALALYMLGRIEYKRYGYLEEGKAHLTSSLESHRALGDSWSTAQCYFLLADLAIIQGDAMKQLQYLEESLAIYRELGDIAGIASALDNLASAIADIEADLRTSQKMVEEAIVIYRQMDAKAPMDNALNVYATILTWKGEFELARKIFNERRETASQYGSQSGIAMVNVFQAVMERVAGNQETANTMLEESLGMLRSFDQRLVLGWQYCLTYQEMALIFARRGKPKEAELLLQEAVQKCDFPEALIKTYYCKGTTAIQRTDGSGALENFLKSLEICRNSHFKLSAILNIEGIADAFRHLDNYESAAYFLGAAAAFRKEIGAPTSPWDLPVIEHLKSSLRIKLGKAAFSQAWSSGQDSNFDEVIELALALQAG